MHRNYIETVLPRLTLGSENLAESEAELPNSHTAFLTTIMSPEVFAFYLVHLSQRVEDIYASASEELRGDLNTFIESLVTARAKTAACVVVEGISAEARQLLNAMKTANGESVCFHEISTPARHSVQWTKGINTSNSSRSYRVLMPLAYCLHIFAKADLNHFALTGGVRCLWDCLEQPNTKVYSLRADGVTSLDWNKVGGPWIEIKTLELGLDYTKDMRRFGLLVPKTTPHTKERDGRDLILMRYLDQWVQLLTLTKKWQMNVEDNSRWPPESHRPWIPDSWRTMPVVVWLRKQQPQS